VIIMRRLMAVMLAAAIIPAVAQAQRRQGGAASSLGSVRGVVYDSLLHAPLEGAHVYLTSGGIGAVTDAAGRFRLDSVPSGPAVIAFEHADLDSAGLSNNAKRIDIIAGRPTVVELDVPSLGTLYRAGCGASTAAVRAADSGMVFGSVEDVGTRARLAGARVLVSWVAARLGATRVEVTRPGTEVRTDSVGNFYACGIPREYVVSITALAGRFASGTTELLLGERGVARRDLGVARDSSGLAEDTGSGARRGRAVLIGMVTDQDGNPRPGARASLDDAASESYTDESGRFMLTNLPAGSQTVMIRMIGYSAARTPVMLRNNDTTRVTLRVKALTVLDTIRVTARSTQGLFALDELEHRLRTGSAFVLRGEEVKRRASMRAVFQGLPSLLIEGRSTFSFTMSSFTAGKYWPVSIYVDGIPTTTEAIQSYRPDQIIAVEWYPRGASAPLQYQSLGHPDSGVMLVWTRFIR
jgi:hypothetical protein